MCVLHVAIENDLDGGRERGQVIGCNHIYTQPWGAVTFGRRGLLRRTFANGSYQPQFIQSRWAQIVDQATNIGNRRLNGLLLLDDKRISGDGVTREQAADSTRTPVERGQHRTETIMQVT